MVIFKYEILEHTFLAEYRYTSYDNLRQNKLTLTVYSILKYVHLFSRNFIANLKGTVKIVQL